MSDALPSVVSAECLTDALQRAGVLGAGRVGGVVVERSWPTILSQITRLGLSYEGGAVGPPSLILKTGQRLGMPAGTRWNLQWGRVGDGRAAGAIGRWGQGRLTRERYALFERLLAAAPGLVARYHRRRDVTVVHGDAHVWNCFLPNAAASQDVRLFDWDRWRIDKGSDDLAYMMAMHWYPDLRRKREQVLLDEFHAVLVEHGVGRYDRQALGEDYRLSVLWHVMTPVRQWDYGIPPLIWWNNLERVVLAFDDLGCGDLF